MTEATLKTVAKLAGVHPGTASRALNPETRDLVSKETANRVRSAAEKLNYKPNPVARALKTNLTKTVGILIPDLTNPLFPPVVRGVEDVLNDAGYTALLANTDNVIENVFAAFERIQARNVDGLLVATAYRKDAFLEEISQSDLPIVLINRMVDDLTLPLVVGDDYGGLFQSVLHLRGLGHEHIAYISGPIDTSTGYVRKLAFRSALFEAGLNVDAKLFVDAEMYTIESGFHAASALLDAAIDFTAIVCGNDLIALGAIDAVASRGLSCPSDISVVGHNDMPFTDRIQPSLTTIHVSQHDTGAEAARMLLRRFAAPDEPVTTVTLPADLVVRESTALAHPRCPG